MKIEIEQNETGWKLSCKRIVALQIVYDRRFKESGKWRTRDAKEFRIRMQILRIKHYSLGVKLGKMRIDINKYIKNNCKELNSHLFAKEN